MLNSLFNLSDGSAPSIILSIALMLFLGFLTTRLTKLMRLPNVTAYIIIGIVIGPFCFGIIPHSIIQGTDFLADIALALISFCIGEYFKVSSFKNNGLKSLLIAVLESVMSSAVVFVLTYFVLRLDFGMKAVNPAYTNSREHYPLVRPDFGRDLAVHFAVGLPF